MNKKTNVETQPYVELRRENVAQRTLQLWQAAGRPLGRDLEFGPQAEVELLSESQRSRPVLVRAPTLRRPENGAEAHGGQMARAENQHSRRKEQPCYGETTYRE
jgi:hypothetical protein